MGLVSVASPHQAWHSNCCKKSVKPIETVLSDNDRS